MPADAVDDRAAKPARAHASGESRFETAAFLDRYEAVEGYAAAEEGISESDARLKRILLIAGTTLLVAGLLLAVYAWVWS